MSPPPALLQMRFDDPIDLVCGDVVDAQDFAIWMGLASLLCLPLVWRLRKGVALEGQQTVWAAIALLLGVVHVLIVLAKVPMGCLSGHALSTIVGSATPWLVAAALLRSAVAPTPDALTSQTPQAPGDRGSTT